MSRSFSIDLNHYHLCRPIGDNVKVLTIPADRSDVVACLESLGYTNISESPWSRARFGSVFCLEDVLAHETLGIPTNARVDVMKAHKLGNTYQLTFTY